MNDGPSWVAVLPVEAVERNGVTLVRAAGRDYVIYDAPDRLYASIAYCTHQGALLRDGYFDIRTGEPKGAPATRKLRIVEVRTRAGMVELRVG